MTKKKDKAKTPVKQDHDKKVQKDLDSLQEAHTALQTERDELFEKLQRVSADYANYQKRVPKQVADSVAYEKEKILKSWLPALDNFEHALQNTENVENVDAVVEGVRMVYDQMLDILKTHGVETIDAVEEVFDPSRHEAMLRQSDPEKEDGVILQEFQKGYVLKDRVLRPSKVIVNKIEVPESEDTDETVETENAPEESLDQEV